jgi:hypothetical protein
MKIRKQLVLVIWALTTGMVCWSQKKEQRALFGEFMQACNAYQQLPLHLNMSCRVSSGLPAAQEDTAMVNGDFYITGNQAYIRFGSTEQLLDDTMALVVMNDIKHMVAYQNSQPLAAQLKSIMNRPLAGETVDQLIEKYRITKIPLDKETLLLRIESKKPVYEGMEPAVTVELTCNTALTMPQKIITTKRSLYKMAEQEAQAQVKTTTIPGKGIFGVREAVTTFFYNKIEHIPGLQLPVAIKDRVMKGTEENLVPAKAYEDYTVTEN